VITPSSELAHAFAGPPDALLCCNRFAQVVAASAALTQRCQSVVFSNDDSARLNSELRRLGGSDSPEEALRALQAAGRTDELLQLLAISDQVRRVVSRQHLSVFHVTELSHSSAPSLLKCAPTAL
jgi:hypothetical protein